MTLAEIVVTTGRNNHDLAAFMAAVRASALRTYPLGCHADRQGFQSHPVNILEGPAPQAHDPDRHAVIEDVADRDPTATLNPQDARAN